MSNTFFSNSLNILVAEAEKPASNPILSFLPLVLIFGAMYFLLLRPQRKRQKAAASLQSSISKGDEVLLTSGIYGWVTAIEDEWLWIELVENVDIRVAKGSVSRIIAVAPTETPAE